MKNVYLAYTPEDGKRAEELRRILLAQGHRPWINPQPTEGAHWDLGTDAAIGAADALIVLVTAAAATSSAVTYEWALALGAGVPRIRDHIRRSARTSAPGDGQPL